MTIPELYEIATPGCMISQHWPCSRETEGATLAAIQWVLEDGFFRAFQTVEVPYSAERRAIAELLAPDGVYLDYCVARVLNENDGNLSSLDEAQRIHTVAIVNRQMVDAAETGASALSVIPGKRPDNLSLRSEALDALRRSIEEITQHAAANYPELQILIEPLDVDADKRHTFGYLEDIEWLGQELTKKNLPFNLILDTAHSWLNQEDPLATLQSIQPQVREFHFCNCITNPTHKLYGDKHMALGEPGIITPTVLAQLVTGLQEINFLNETDRPHLFFEILKPKSEDSKIHVANCQQFFTESLAMVRFKDQVPALTFNLQTQRL